jgi:two-component system OmpR family sensor kinase
MPTSLYARLVLGWVALVALLGGLSLFLNLHLHQLYLQELNQKFNRTLAANLVAEKGLAIEDGRFDPAALDAVFHAYMVVNPSIEVYLLDAEGRILGFSAPPGKLQLARVDLGPVRAFLRDDARLPIVGDDPRNPDMREVFSAAPVGPPGRPRGYLYVVLASEQLQSAAEMIAGSYLLRVALIALGASTLLIALSGLWLLHIVTRRLRRLDRAMAAFEAEASERPAPPPGLDTGGRDEIGRLGRTFASMARRITAQFDRLKQTDALRRELVANVSHDLRTPIASLQGYLETLLIKEKTLTSAERRQYVEIAIRHSERLGKLVAELFELAKLESGHMELHREPFSLGELVQDVALKFRLRAESRGVAIATRIPEQLPFVDADIGLIERVLENLIDNAIRHTPESGRVEVSLEARDAAVAVHVADTGHGIPAAELPHVFDRFYQVRKSERETSGGAGLGLGLAIAKRILDLHASTIAVSSVLEVGTRVDFSLPVRTCTR